MVDRNRIMLPNAKEIERAVLGSILTNNCYHEVQDVLTDDCFYQERYRQIYKVCKTIIDRGEEPSLLNVPLEMPEGLSAAAEIAEIAGNSIVAKVRQYAIILQELSNRRKIWVACQWLASRSLDTSEDIEDAIGKFRTDVDAVLSELSPTIITLHDALRLLYQLVTNNTNGATAEQGTLTGFNELDRKGGLHPSDLVIIAGESSHGKTSFANSIVLNAITSGARVAFYSMEMTAKQMMARMAAILSGVSANHILYNPLSVDELGRVDSSIGELLNVQGELYMDDRSTSNIDTIIASIRTNKLRNNIDGAVVDYLQILNVNMRNVNKEQAMAEVARRLKNLAKELGIWIIALSQLNRADGEPSISRLRDSGQIAEAADVVMLVYRPEQNKAPRYNAPFENVDTKGTALVKIAKGRNIGTGEFICGFKASTTHFYDIETLPSLSARQEQEKEGVKMPF